jgi:peptidyl-tRNA hydrolase, PTH2 family
MNKPLMRRIKQVIVIRKDLKMRRGKEIAQGSHASMAFLTRQLQTTKEETGKLGWSWWNFFNKKEKEITLSDTQQQWLDSSFAKVTVRVNSEEELENVFRNAKDAGLEVHMVTDSGLTEFGGVPTKTCLAIGPDYADLIDSVTGELRLY